jgi:hypothetical protein
MPLLLKPRVRSGVFDGPFATAWSWGTVTSHREETRVSQTIRVESGSLAIREWAAPAPARGMTAQWRLRSAGLPAPRIDTCPTGVVLHFDEAPFIGEGESGHWSLEGIDENG